MPAQLRAERLGRAGNLRRRIADEALRRLETTLANAIAIALASHLPVLVIISAKCVADLRLKTFLDDQARRQPHQFAAPRLRRQTSLDQVSKPFSRPFTPWYPSRHGGASFHGPANARPVEIHTSKGCTSSKFPSKSRTSPSLDRGWRAARIALSHRRSPGSAVSRPQIHPRRALGGQHRRGSCRPNVRPLQILATLDRESCGT